MFMSLQISLCPGIGQIIDPIIINNNNRKKPLGVALRSHILKDGPIKSKNCDPGNAHSMPSAYKPALGKDRMNVRGS